MFIFNLDQSLFLYIQNYVGSSLTIDNLFIYIAQYSSLFFAFILSVFCLFVLKKKGRESINILLTIITVFIIVIALSYFSRYFIARPRPFNELYFQPLLIRTGYNSLPSNHATAAFFIAFLLYFFKEKLGLALIIGAVLTAFSRVYVGLHYPLDIIIGAILAIICFYFSKNYLLKFKEKI